MNQQVEAEPLEESAEEAAIHFILIPQKITSNLSCFFFLSALWSCDNTQ